MGNLDCFNKILTPHFSFSLRFLTCKMGCGGSSLPSVDPELAKAASSGPRSRMSRIVPSEVTEDTKKSWKAEINRLNKGFDVKYPHNNGYGTKDEVTKYLMEA